MKDAVRPEWGGRAPWSGGWQGSYLPGLPQLSPCQGDTERVCIPLPPVVPFLFPEGDLRGGVFTPPGQDLPAHAASLGMRFHTGQIFPDDCQNQIFIAEHGSWKRVVPPGCRISLIRRADKTPVSYEVLARGWLEGRAVFPAVRSISS